ncbi:hypothetical protein MKS85_10395 [Pseudomonas sp. JL2]|uniref:hypothetical protein n=1 Tax=Pseudomonas sp. JL2 TaxID=2919942 RepID=UPI00285B54A3|nr:hypothetical protein [Pseudomonas sp. JL2]MDR8385941.1 hypothetical protein [Pseudomonas sp. JL2]
MVTKPAGQNRCKSLVRTNANDWSGRMQAGGQVECNFAVAEHNRRQQLIISALEQELATIDQHIAEAQQEHQKIENKALHLANAVLEEKWNEAAQALLDVGGQLCAARRMIDRDPVALLKLNVPEQGENFSSWDWSDLSERSVRYKVQDVLAL